MKRLMLSVAAIALVAIPTFAAAQPADGRRGGDRGYAQRDFGGGRNFDRGGRDNRRDFQRGPQQGGRDFRNDRRAGPPPRAMAPPPRAPAYRQPPPRAFAPAPRWDRNQRDWWRGRPDFRGYAGVRQGFWFAPGYGYVRMDPRWNNRAWRRGDLVPMGFRNYYVADPYFFGLGMAPPGHQWIYLGNNIVLMSLATGLIVDMLANVYW